MNNVDKYALRMLIDGTRERTMRVEQAPGEQQNCDRAYEIAALIEKYPDQFLAWVKGYGK